VRPRVSEDVEPRLETPPVLRAETLDQPAQTLAAPITLEGGGLHMGRHQTATLAPAEPGWWLTDATGHHHRVETCTVADTARASTLELPDGSRVSMVEHVLAAISGLALDGVALSVGPFENGRAEVPALDGSAAIWCDAIDDVGLRDTDEGLRVWVLDTPVALADSGSSRRTIRARPLGRPDRGDDGKGQDGRAAHGSLRRRVTVELEFEGLPDDMPQTFTWDESTPFEHALAGARTFAFASWLDNLWARGLIRGGQLDNALVFEDREPERGTLLTPHPLRWPDEPARHKALDLVGDLALLGRPLVADIHSARPGHTLNQRFVERLLSRRDR